MIRVVVGSLHGRLRERERRGQGQALVVHCGVYGHRTGEASLAVSKGRRRVTATRGAMFPAAGDGGGKTML